MAKILVKNVVQRKPGYLYFIDKAGNVCEALMARTGRKKGSSKKKKVITKTKVKVKAKGKAKTVKTKSKK
jgi:hypothetical protein